MIDPSRLIKTVSVDLYSNQSTSFPWGASFLPSSLGRRKVKCAETVDLDVTSYDRDAPKMASRIQCVSPAIYKWQIPVQYGMMDIDVTIDKSGRLVLPKPVRDALGLRAGDRLKIRRQGSEVILSFSQPKPVLQKEKGVWVYRSGQSSDVSLPDLIEQERRRREAELS